MTKPYSVHPLYANCLYFRIHKDEMVIASIQLESNSLPHAHVQTTKTYYKHQDSRIMKAQELKTKTSAQTLIYKIFLQRYQVYQGRLLASFQNDAKYEHVGQDTRSQGGKDDQDKQGKDLKISDIKTKETPEIPVSKKKEKVDVTRGKGIELLSQVALNEDAQFKEVQRKNMRDFHKNHPSSSGAVKIIPSVTSKGTGVKPEVPDVTEEESSESKAESWGNDEDDSNNEQDSSDVENDSNDDKPQSDNENKSDYEHEKDENDSDSKFDQEENEEDDEEEEEVVKTPSNNFDDEDETKITDKAKGDEDEEMDYTTSLLYDDVDIRLNEPVDTDKGLKTEVPVSSSSHSSNLAAKFLNFSDIPTIEAEIVSPMDVHVHHEVSCKQTPTLLTVHVSVITDSSPVFSTVIPHSLQSFTPPLLLSTPTPPTTTKATNPPSTLPDFESVFQINNRVTTWEQEVAELKKDPLRTQVMTLVDEHLDAKLGATRDEFMNFLSKSLTARIAKQIKDQLPQIFPEEETSQPQSSYEDAATLTEFELKKILIDKMDKSESYLTAPEHRECYEGLRKSYDLDKTFFDTYEKKRKTGKDAEPTKGPKAKESQSGSSKGTKSHPKSSSKSIQSEEPEFEVAGTRSNYVELEYDFKECCKALPEKLDWENQEGGEYPFDLTKPLPLVMSRNHQKVSVDYFFNNNIKYLQGGISTMTYTTSLTKTKAAQYDLLGIEDMVSNIWVPIKVAYDKHALWGISHWREQRKTFYGYARGLQSTHDVYSTKRILVVTQVEVMSKHGYGYLKEIFVKRAYNDLYRFKEGDFPRLCINDIEDMLLLVVQN
ncbi:hypothetical protein Tco_1575624 [Tanacetum coccineum]